jgi:hypothetical protein
LIASFDPTTIGQRDLARRLKVVSRAELPSGWAPGRLPRPTLPIDECVQILRRKRRLRDPVELRRQHPLGICPFALARHGALRAALYAASEQEKQDSLKPVVLDALKYLREEGPRLRTALYAGEVRAEVIRANLDQLGDAVPRIKRLCESLSRSRELLEATAEGIVSARRDLSKRRGNVWRLSFVTALFAEWWILTAHDPKASPGPCQEFICAAWCSLSPLAAPTDADWGSAIKVARSRCRAGSWRVPPD